MRRLAFAGGVVLCSVLFAPALAGQSGPPPLTPFRGLFDLVSQNAWGMSSTGGNEGSSHAISADGRYVVFSSLASDLVPDDTNYSYDVFLRDRVTGTTTRVSLGPGGVEGNGFSYPATISADGRHVAFTSNATNLVAGDTNGRYDVFVRDVDDNRTVLVSVATGGAHSDGDSGFPSVSADGRYVAFVAHATTLAPGTVPNGPMQVYLRDRDSDGDGIFDEPDATTTTLVSAGIGGAPADQMARHPRVSADARYVMFESAAGNLDPVGNSGPWITHLYVYDRVGAAMTLIDRAVTGGPSAFGVQADTSDMSEDGRFVTYSSQSADILGPMEPIHAQAFVYDSAAEPAYRTKIVSRRPDGTLMDATSGATTVSADGRYVGFTSGTYNPALPGMFPNVYRCVRERQRLRRSGAGESLAER
jgi:Tol biopolymer transport system component